MAIPDELTVTVFQERVIPLLQRWYNAMQDGSASYWFPSSQYIGKAYTDADVDRIIAAIDQEISQEIARSQGHWAAKGITVAASFTGLEHLQRRALVEEVAGIAEQWATQPATSPSPDHEEEEYRD